MTPEKLWKMRNVWVLVKGKCFQRENRTTRKIPVQPASRQYLEKVIKPTLSPSTCRQHAVGSEPGAAGMRESEASRPCCTDAKRSTLSLLSVQTGRPHERGKNNEKREEFKLQTASQVRLYFPGSGETLRRWHIRGGGGGRGGNAVRTSRRGLQST